MATYSIAVTVEQLRVVSAALQELPYRISAPVLADLQRQVDAEDERRRKAEAATEKAEDERRRKAEAATEKAATESASEGGT